MNVEATGSLPLTQPFRDRNGISLSWRRGDVVQPLDAFSGAQWFAPPFFREVYRSYTRIPLPFLTARWGRFGFYAGAKGFGVDSPAYLHMLPADQVYPGSVAMMLFSIRFTTALSQGA